MKARTIVLVLSLICSNFVTASCILEIPQSTMELKVVEGKEVYVVPKGLVDQLECRSNELRDRQAQRIRELEAALSESQNLIANYQLNSDSLARTLTGYVDAGEQLQSTLERSTDLTAEYDALTTRYKILSQQYSKLLDRFDALIDEYRDVAMNAHSPFSIDAGVGLDTNGDPMGLIGVEVKRIRVWGVHQEDSSGVIVGWSFPF